MQSAWMTSSTSLGTTQERPVMPLPEFLIDHPDGEIRITGHRISLLNVVDLYNEGHSAEVMATEYFDTLSTELLQKIIDFYLTNRFEVDAYVAKERAEIERQMAAHVPGPGYLRIRKLMEEKGLLEPQGDAATLPPG
jgi:uncharacterized protein (DUF433 family)